MSALVAVLMGSTSDEERMAGCGETLQRFGIEYEQHVMSAHRTPDKVAEFARAAAGAGIEVIIAGAGGAAALPGVIAAYSALPVLGVPLDSSPLGGVDALHAIVQMPPGVPVATMSVGSWGARNAAVFAAEILALKHDDVAEVLTRYRNEQAGR
ncbi:MAG: 5-(carboxyamino)imidazole ribonucleotide mutase [Dehalococcoidia bacterium]|jgi:phosphoribosylaminoimidazole carboxylase PurE protein|nr:5-(carboxyamino)imidazole ribonucleotide mutase [Dehalococcoidia bacterium]